MTYSVLDIEKFKTDLRKILALFDSIGAVNDEIVIDKCVGCQNWCRVAMSKKICLSCFLKPNFDRLNVPQHVRDEIIAAGAEVAFKVGKENRN